MPGPVSLFTKENARVKNLNTSWLKKLPLDVSASREIVAYVPAKASATKLHQRLLLYLYFL